MLLVPCGVFYDDFPMFSPEELAADTDQSASELLDLFGLEACSYRSQRQALREQL